MKLRAAGKQVIVREEFELLVEMGGTHSNSNYVAG